MHTAKSACAFPSVNEYRADESPTPFPIAAILPQNIDLYEKATWSTDILKDYRSWRPKSSKPLEQIAVLVAMAQRQAEGFDTSRVQTKDSGLDIFEVLCLSRQL
jgi:hypothetical protein